MPRNIAAVPGFEELLAVAAYNPASLSVYTAGAAWGAVDGTNLVSTVVVPPTGNLLVRLTALYALSGAVTSGGLIAMWGVDIGGGSPLAAAVLSEVTSTAPGNVQPFALASVPLFLTGLTPGASATIRWLYTYSESSGASISTPVFKTYAGQSSAFSPVFSSPASMEIWAV